MESSELREGRLTLTFSSGAVQFQVGQVFNITDHKSLTGPAQSPANATENSKEQEMVRGSRQQSLDGFEGWLLYGWGLESGAVFTLLLFGGGKPGRHWARWTFDRPTSVRLSKCASMATLDRVEAIKGEEGWAEWTIRFQDLSTIAILGTQVTVSFW